MYIFFIFSIIIKNILMSNNINELVSYLRLYDSNIVNIFIYTQVIDKKTNFLNKLDIKKYKKCGEREIDINCCICCVDVKKTEFIRELNCNHIFHKKCIDRWLLMSMKENDSVNCPICRTNINIK
jgi:hypothetical protein